MTGNAKINSFGQVEEPSKDPSSPQVVDAEHKDKPSRPKYPSQILPVGKWQNTSQPGSRSSYTKFQRVPKKK